MLPIAHDHKGGGYSRSNIAPPIAGFYGSQDSQRNQTVQFIGAEPQRSLAGAGQTEAREERSEVKAPDAGTRCSWTHHETTPLRTQTALGSGAGS